MGRLRRALTSIAVLAIASTALASCGDEPDDASASEDSNSSTTVGTSTTDGPAPTTEAPPATSQQTTTTEATASWSFFITSPDQWRYEVKIDQAGIELRAATDISQSPPGQARVHLQGDFYSTGDVSGSTPGRTPPFAGVHYIYAYYAWGDQYDNEIGRCIDLYESVAINGGVADWRCPISLKDGSTSSLSDSSGRYNDYSFDWPEAAASAAVGAINGSEPLAYGVEFNGPELFNCGEIILYLDGSVGDSPYCPVG